MITTPSQLLELQRVQVGALNAVGQVLVTGAERLSKLNANASRGAMNVATEAAHTFAGTAQGQPAGAATPSSEQALQTLVNYARDWVGIANSIGADLTKLVEQQITESNRRLTEMLESAATSAPLGTQQAVAMLRNAISASNAAFDTVSKASRQAADWTQANVSQAGKAATSAAVGSG